VDWLIELAALDQLAIFAEVLSNGHPYSNPFNVQRHPTSARTHQAFRASAMQIWREVAAAA
jgi:hypothetical protein